MRAKLKSHLVLPFFLLVLFFCFSVDTAAALKNDAGDISEITKKVYPSVVKVEARNFTRKVATGVVINKDGIILTTALITPHDEEIFVTNSEGKRVEAQFLGMDPVTYLALLKVEEKGLPPIEEGETKDLAPGAWIGVISMSPENTPAVTQGIVSSISEEKLRLNVWVTPGSSGSPVVDKKGKMVGLLRGIYSEDKPVVFEFREKELVGSGYVISRAEAPSSGMALAIPVAILTDICDEIREKGKVERGWLGVNIIENEEGNVEIAQVEKDSPAELAKLKEKDVVLEIEDKKLTESKMLVDEIRKRKPGDNVTLKIDRDGKEQKVKVKLGLYTEKDIRRELSLKFPRLFPPESPGVPQPPQALQPREPLYREFMPRFLETRKFIGVYLEELNLELSEFFGVKEGRGLLVSRVEKDSPAEKAGLQVGDVIIKADGKPVDKISGLSELIQKKNKGDQLEIEFLRDKKKMTVKVEIDEEKRERGLFYQFSQGWNDYRDTLGDYYENLEKSYKDWWKEHGDEVEKNMKKLNEEAKKLSKRVGEQSQEAAKKLSRYLGMYKGLRV